MRVYREKDVAALRADPDCFTGEVWRTEHIPRVGQDGLVGHRFSYAPGSRSHWHIHHGDQALVVVSGRGLVSWEAETQAMTPGDWVHVDPRVRHWHGAAADSLLVHLAITAGGATEWLERVNDEDYQLAQLAMTVSR